MSARIALLNLTVNEGQLKIATSVEEDQTPAQHYTTVEVETGVIRCDKPEIIASLLTNEIKRKFNDHYRRRSHSAYVGTLLITFAINYIFQILV